MSDLIDAVEAEIELAGAAPSSKKKADKAAVEELEATLANHRLHVTNMEIVRGAPSLFRLSPVAPLVVYLSPQSCLALPTPSHNAHLPRHSCSCCAW